ncbi:hypothetical protein [Actomonas aquatica]|uniref:N-acetyltransferase domain-containing protein n=1 Tax=Actomonas aquatica TaxID=2866162 RepID=A0ABZ1C470_9BACT|nr:hypothetical protein [Opitutus sp. WL0086]WRQ86251.1 hypothetical protein K1X11_015655 [Opitutus sp. WL0086]
MTILYLRAAARRHGTGRAFLRSLKSAGLRVHVQHPTQEALPFWRHMRTQQLLDDDPDAVRSWEDFLSPLECQMKAPECFETDD